MTQPGLSRLWFSIWLVSASALAISCGCQFSDQRQPDVGGKNDPPEKKLPEHKLPDPEAPNPIEMPTPPLEDKPSAAFVNPAAFIEALHERQRASGAAVRRLDEANDYPATASAWYRLEGKPADIAAATEPLNCKGNRTFCDLAKARDCAGSSLLHLAVARDDLIGVNHVLFHAPGLIAAKDQLGRTPLLVAIGLGRLAIVERLLLVQGIGQDWSPHSDADGRGPWHHLAMFGPTLAGRTDLSPKKRSEIAISLGVGLRIGQAPPDSPDRHGYTPLMTAIRVGAAEVAEILVTAGARVRLPATEATPSLQPLHLLARHADRFPSPAAAVALLTRLAPTSADLDAVSPDGLTPLGEAIRAGRAAASPLLPALSGPSPTAGPAARGLSPVAFALHLGHIDLARTLIAAGHPTEPAWLAATSQGPDLPAGLVEACLQPDVTGLACAHIAAQHGNLAFLKAAARSAPTLLRAVTHTAPPLPDTLPMATGSNFLHVAVAHGRADIVRWAAAIDDLALRADIQRLVAQSNASGFKPADLTLWRRDALQHHRASRRIADLATLPISIAGSLGHGAGQGAGLGLSGTGLGGGGHHFNRNEGVGPEHASEKPPPPFEGASPDDSEGEEQRPSSFQVLGFGGASQVREYPVDEDFPGPRLETEPLVFHTPLSQAEADGFNRRRDLLRTCIAEGNWLAAERLTSEYLGHLDVADPFRSAYAVEAIHLRFRVLTSLPAITDKALKAARNLGEAALHWVDGLVAAIDLRAIEDGPAAPNDTSAILNAPARRAAIGFRNAQGAERLDRGDLDGARAILEHARSQASRAQPLALAHLLGTLGRLETAVAAHDKALEHFRAADTARRNAPSLGPGPVVSNLINLGTVLDLVGRADDARATWSEALALTTACDDCPQALFAAILSHNLARLALSDGDFDHAHALNNAARRSTSIPGAGPAWIAGRIALTAGDIIVAETEAAGDTLDNRPDDRAAAIAHYKNARSLLESAHGVAHPLIGRALWRLADIDGAPETRRDRFVEAWAMTATAPEERWALAFAWSRFEEGAGRLDVASFLARASVISLQQIRRGVRNLGDATEGAWLAARLEVYRHATRLALKVGRAGDATTIIGLQEIETHLAFRRSDNWSGATPQLPLEPAERRVLGANSRGAAASDPASPDNAKDFREKVADVKAFLKELDRRRPSAHAARGTLSHQAEQARALQSTLRRVGDGTVWVHLVPTETDITAIITTPKRQFTRTHPLPDVDLARIVQRFKESLLQRKPGIEAAAEQLYTTILAPFRADLAGARIVYIAADGMLRDVPFAALHDGTDWLGASFVFVSASFLTLSRLERVPPPLGDWRVEGFGVSKASRDFSALPGVADELGGIIARVAGGSGARNAPADGLPGRVRLDSDFKPEALYETLRENAPPIIMIASHFKLGHDEGDSFLVTGDGGRLTVACMNDCDTTCLAACTDPGSNFSFQDVHLVVLSACNTAQQAGGSGRGRGAEREPASSLVDVAAILGADAVVGTLWPVADPSTAAFMRLFFKQMRELGGRDKAIALQRASRALANGEVGDGKWTHPYYWAPFVMLGNAR